MNSLRAVLSSSLLFWLGLVSADADDDVEDTDDEVDDEVDECLCC